MRLLGKEVKARTLLKRAGNLWREIVPDRGGRVGRAMDGKMDGKLGEKTDAELTLGDFDGLVSVMHSGTRCIPASSNDRDRTRLNNLVGPCP